MSDIFSNRLRVLCATEGTYGPDAVDAILQDGAEDILYQDVRNCELTSPRAVFQPSRNRASSSGVDHITFSDESVVSMEGPLNGKRGSGAGNEEPFYASILKAMGMEVAVSSGTSATYTPITVNPAGMTVYKFYRETEGANYRLQYATGVRGNGQFQFTVNEEAFFTFDGAGLYTGQLTDEAAFFDAAGEAALLKDGSTAVTARTTGTEEQSSKDALGCQGLTVEYDSTTMPVSNLSLNLNQTVTRIRTVNGTGSVSKVLLNKASDARITGSFDLQDTGATFELLRDAMVSDSSAQIDVSIGDGTDTIALTMPNVQIGVMSMGANDSIVTHTVPFMVSGDWSDLAANNDFTLVYT